MPSVSIIIPLYNKKEFIRNSIQSVLNQTYGDFEIVIVNDGSTDNSLEIVKSIHDDRIRIIDKENGGVSSARNVGIDNSVGEWIIFLDADDTIRQDCLQTLINLHNQFKEADVCCGNFIQKYPNIKNCCYCKGREPYLVKNNFRDFYKQKIYLHTGIFIITRKALCAAGRFDESYSLFEDIALFFKVLKSSKIAYTPEVVFEYEKAGSEGSRRIQSLSKVFDVSLSDYSGYEKKVRMKILVDEIITARKDFQMVKALLLREKSEWLYILVHFLPCFISSVRNARILSRMLSKYIRL